MSKKRGLSLDEKKSRLCELFYEKKEAFLLKELEKMAPKEKGIVAQSVKEVLQMLVDDNLVETDKIGTSVYFWSFPSQALNLKRQKIETLKTQLKEANEKLKKVDGQLKLIESDRKDPAEREARLKQLESLNKSKEELSAKISQISGCDPEVLMQKKKDIPVAKEAINRWTDNVFAIKTWCKDKFMMEETEINKQFEIPDDFDYL